MSTQSDNKDLVEARWKSVLNHTQNIHDGHGDLFPVCSHPKLSKLDERATKWLKHDSEVSDGLQKIVENKSLLKRYQKRFTLWANSRCGRLSQCSQPFCPQKIIISLLKA